MQQELEEARKEIEQARRQLVRASQFGGAGGAHEDFLARADKELAQRQRSTRGGQPGCGHARSGGRTAERAD